MIDGIFNVFKPPSLTSFDVVAHIRRICGTRRVGHGGTLDPLAVGVLPIFVGRATRMVSSFQGADKRYLAVVAFGRTTTTYDSAGETVLERDASAVTFETIESALGGFRGEIQQLPPMYSAIKYQGKRLYELARAGVEVDRRPRTVRIYDLRPVSWAFPELTIEVDCGSGTYIRSLAYDLGEKLGCGAYLRSLVRLRSGPFDIADSVQLPDLSAAVAGDYWQELNYPLDLVVPHFPAVVIRREWEESVLNGDIRFLRKQTGVGGGVVRLYSEDGRFLALVSEDAPNGRWQVDRIIAKGIDK